MTNIHHPSPINQFYKMDYDEVQKEWVKVERWSNVVAGHNFDSENCMAAEGAVLVDAHTNGAIHTSPAGIRNYQDDFSGGIGVDDVQVAAKRHFGLDIPTPDFYNRYDVLAAVKARRHVAIGVDYRRVPIGYQRQVPGNFDHALGIDDYRPSDGMIFVYDSLTTKAHWQPQSSVFPAAEALAIQHRGTRERLFVAVSRIRPLIVTTPQLAVSIHPLKGAKGYPTYRYFGLYTVVNGIVTHTEVHRTGGFSASADSLKEYPWLGHTKQELVRLTSGDLKDFYVRSSYIVEK